MSDQGDVLLSELKRLVGWFDLHGHPGMVRDVLNIIVKADPQWVRTWDEDSRKGEA